MLVFNSEPLPALRENPGRDHPCGPVLKSGVIELTTPSPPLNRHLIPNTIHTIRESQSWREALYRRRQHARAGVRPVRPPAAGIRRTSRLPCWIR